MSIRLLGDMGGSQNRQIPLPYIFVEQEPFWRIHLPLIAVWFRKEYTDD
jgi:hypothetical protein